MKHARTAITSGGVCAFVVLLAAEADSQWLQLVIGFCVGLGIDYIVRKYVVHTQ